eukprot:Skav200361  [mRNA]  locus=scaffold2518:54691:60675:- [translate_table: standard]
MPSLPAAKSDLVVCGLSGKRYSGVAELYELLKPLLVQGVVLIPRDGLCSVEALDRYERWARACFFIRVEASEAVRKANGWKSQFGSDGDLVRDEHWTELALDEWTAWDAVPSQLVLRYQLLCLSVALATCQQLQKSGEAKEWD